MMQRYLHLSNAVQSSLLIHPKNITTAIVRKRTLSSSSHIFVNPGVSLSLSDRLGCKMSFNMDERKVKQRHTVIIGAGIMGCTTAYYITRHPSFDPTTHRVTILEASNIAAGASGNAGGLLAKWAYPDPLVPLSYRLHAELAAKHGGEQRWGYRKVKCGSIDAMGKYPAKVRERAVTVPEEKMKDKEREEQASKVMASVAATAGSNIGPTTAARFALFEDIQASGTEEVKAQDNTSQAHKDWEKIPKQDTAATSLLVHDSPLPKDLDWYDGTCVQSWAEMGVPGVTTETAQVHPYHFTTSIAELAQESGARIILGAQVTDILVKGKAGVKSVAYRQRFSSITPIPSPTIIAASDAPMPEPGPVHPLTIDDVTEVVVCAGPWTGKLVPKSCVEGPRAHSVVYEADVSPYAVFSQIQLPEDFIPDHRKEVGGERVHKQTVDPEVYARPFGEVYACGEIDSSIPLPETADRVNIDLRACDDITAYLSTVSAVLGNAPIKERKACYLPIHTRFGEERGPLIGKTLTKGLYLASGHSCWGIQNGPGTGKLMSEILMDGGAKSVDIAKFEPIKFKIGAGLGRRATDAMKRAAKENAAANRVEENRGAKEDKEGKTDWESNTYGEPKTDVEGMAVDGEAKTHGETKTHVETKTHGETKTDAEAKADLEDWRLSQMERLRQIGGLRQM